MYYEVDFSVDTAVDQRIVDLNRNSRFVTFASYPLVDINGGRVFTLNYSQIPTQTRNKIGFGLYSGDTTFEMRNVATDTRITSTTRNVTNELIPIILAGDYVTNTSGNTTVSEGSSKGIRYYGIKVYDNYVLVGDYIPVKRKSDNLITLYDKVTKDFCSIIGDGTLIAGNEVT